MNPKPSHETLLRQVKTLEEKLSACRRSEELFRDRDQQLKAMVEAFDGLIYVSSKDYRVTFMNRQYIDRIGYDATGQRCYKALHNRDEVCPWCLNNRVFKGETVRCEVLTHRNKWYSVVSTPMYHSDGSVSKQAMIIDISDRKHAAASLKKKVEEQELLLDNIQTQIWYLTDVKTFGAVNMALAKFLGVEKKDIERRPISGVLDTEAAEVSIAGNIQVFNEKIQIHTEEWAVNGAGERRLLSVTKTPKLDKNGKVEYVVCSGVDITDQRSVEKSLRRSKERLDLALEATNDALWDWNLKSNEAYFSPRFYTMLDYIPYEMPQRFDTWKSLIHPEDIQAVLNTIDDYIHERIDTYEVEYRMKNKAGGWRWIMARGKTVGRNETGPPHRMIGTHVDITERKLSEEALRVSEAHLREENIRLRSSLKGSTHFGTIIGKSQVMQGVYETILKAALSNANVILYGESGTGKELVAQTIHELSDRSAGKFVTVNCGAIPDNLIESEFFGYKKGAFTGAHMDKHGFLDEAEGGTLFLDEIGEIDLNMQVKLLRAIEGGGYTPLGGRVAKKPDIRIVAATNKDLKELINKGLMREDFFYRIHIIPISLPPLRDRKEDIPLLIHHFLETDGDRGKIPAIPEKVIQSMQNRHWPGNVRELQNAVRRYITLKEVDFTDLPQSEPPLRKMITEELMTRGNRNLNMRDMVECIEKKYIEKLLQENQWHRSKVAAILGVNRRTLFRKIKTYGIGLS